MKNKFLSSIRTVDSPLISFMSGWCMCLAAMEMCCSDLSLRENLSWGMLLRQVPLQSASALKPIKQCPGSLAITELIRDKGQSCLLCQQSEPPNILPKPLFCSSPVGCRISITVWSLSALFLFHWSYLQQISWTLNSVLGICFLGYPTSLLCKNTLSIQRFTYYLSLESFPICVCLSFPWWKTTWGCPDSSVGKESACNAGDSSSIHGLGRSIEEGIGYPLQYSWASLVTQLIKNLPAMWETWVRSLEWEDLKGKVTHSSILAWRIPWTTVHGVTKESDMVEQLSFSLSFPWMKTSISEILVSLV